MGKKGKGEEALTRGARLSARERKGEGRGGARLSHGGGGRNGPGKGKWGSWASAGFPGGFPFFFFFSFLVSFPKHFPYRILKEQIISNQKQSTQNKICLSMNAQNHVTKLMINFNFPKII
jgi:hypothetical protein